LKEKGFLNNLGALTYGLPPEEPGREEDSPVALR